jgi:hypothetical protein
MSGTVVLASLSGATLMGSESLPPVRQAVRPPPVHLQAVAPDSERVLADVRSQQRRFERTRRLYFPYGYPWAGRCDERIGRFCLSHDEDDDWEPAPEPMEVALARRTLLDSLGAAAASLPGDSWILGQRVRYRIESGSPREAFDVAASCRLEARWWCHALAGHALHAAGDFRDAEMWFDRALDGMPLEERCRWTDLEPILRGKNRGRYNDVPCPERSDFERQFWTLADPLWLIPGNERRTEHLSRWVWDRLQRDADSGYGLRWGRDLREILLRFGWPRGWDIGRRRYPGLRTEEAIQAHRSPEAQEFTPRAEWVHGSGPSSSDAWELDPDRPRASWTPPYGPVRSLGHQFARFRRGDSLLIVAAIDPSAIESGRDSRVSCTREAGLFFATDAGVRNRTVAEGPHSLRMVANVGPAPGPDVRRFVGVEARCLDRARAARARYELDSWSAERPLLSDLLLIQPADSLPGTLDAAVPIALGSLKLRPHRVLGVFWEWYGPISGPEPVQMTLTLAREGKSFWRRAIEWTGLAGRRTESVGLRWGEHMVGESPPTRSVRLELPDLPEGRYRLTLEVRSSRIGAVSSSRELTVER